MFGYYLDLALRSLKRNKVLTALMVLAIAVGIGASMTTLTVLHLLSGDPLPGRSQHLYFVQMDGNPTKGDYKEPLDKLDYQSAIDLWNTHKANRQAVLNTSSVKVRAPESKLPPLLLDMLSTHTDFFPMFAVPFQYGGPWTAQDDESRSRVAVISSDLNQKLFGGGNSVGKTLRLHDTDVRIIGVLAPWRPTPVFYGVAGGRFAAGQTSSFYGKTEDVFVPFQSGLEINDGNFYQFTCWAQNPTPGHLINSPCVWLSLWVQLDDSAKVAEYKRTLDGYAAAQAQLGRVVRPQNTRMRDLMSWLDFNGVVPSDVRLQTWLAFAFLAICLFNTIGLLLAKFLRRAGEIGVRRALGATRGAIFAQCLVEAGVVGVVGGALGLLFTLGGLSVVRRQPVEFADLAHLDLSMFALTFVLALFTSVAAGLIPAIRASRVTPGLQLKTL